ncbi:MAG: FAD-dependent oxidoreductase [Clostridia bacterium]|nr:FAD-dependent oxidoreductase [Clostridia bacterium]
MKKSIWESSAKLPGFNKLEKDIKTDVLIVGGGLAGILCAHFLKQAGVSYVLVEGSKIASGTTKNTTAKITSQHGLIYDKLIQKFGKEKAQMYLSANEKALKEYDKLCQAMDCDYEKKSAFTYSTTDRKKIEDEVRAVISLGFNAEFRNKTELPFNTKGAICFQNQAQFNPIKFICEISKDLNIYENTFIHDITPHTAFFDGGRIKADKIIVTTHFPFINKHGSYFLKLYQHRSYVSAFSGVKNLSGMYVDEALDGLSFKSYDNLLLIGGGSHRTGKTGGNWEELNIFAKKYYPKAELKYEWAAQDCMSLDSIPYIGRYSKNTPNLFVATGFNKWGMTSSMVAAQILCDMVQDRKNDYAEVFSPQRSILKPQLFVNGFETAANFLTPKTKRCSHLGCALKWNKYEHSWDCACHGSRFTEDGRIIDNPATKRLKK